MKFRQLRQIILMVTTIITGALSPMAQQAMVSRPVEESQAAFFAHLAAKREKAFAQRGITPAWQQPKKTVKQPKIQAQPVPVVVERPQQVSELASVLQEDVGEEDGGDMYFDEPLFSILPPQKEAAKVEKVASTKSTQVLATPKKKKHVRPQAAAPQVKIKIEETPVKAEKEESFLENALVKTKDFFKPASTRIMSAVGTTALATGAKILFEQWNADDRPADVKAQELWGKIKPFMDKEKIKNIVTNDESIKALLTLFAFYLAGEAINKVTKMATQATTTTEQEA